MSARLEISESRYDRQERIGWWDQEVLRAARVLVVGAGALGNELVKNLALLGVGSIVVIDFDVVELSNLARCVLFRGGDDGLPKATVLAERAAELNPDVRVVGLQGDVRSLGAGAFLRADAVVGALDNREARLHLNRLAWRTGRPWVDGAIEALAGVARVFRPPTSCYECTLSEADFAALAHRQSCRLLGRDDLVAGKVPTTVTMASIIAGFQAQEVVKLLHGERSGMQGLDGAYVIDGMHNDAYMLTYPFNEDCLAHDPFDDPVAVGLADASAADVLRALGASSGLVELGDDHVHAWRCPTCELDTDAGMPASMLTLADGVCPTCGADRQPLVISSVEVPGPHADAALRDLGLRHDEMVAVRSEHGRGFAWLQSPLPGLPEEWT